MHKRKEHQIYLDIIRIIATFLVIFTHTGNIGSKLYMYGDYGVIRKLIYLLADILRCVNIPFFFMISGTLLLGRDESLGSLFKKRILRYILVLIVMSYFYFTVYYKYSWYDWKLFLEKLCSQYVTGLYWFLYSYLGFLLILPFLRKMVRSMSNNDYKYFLILGILFKNIFNVVIGLCGWGNFLIPFYFATDAMFYPIIGYGISKIEGEYNVEIGREVVGGIGSILCVLFTGIMMHWEACRVGEYQETYLFSFLVIPAIWSFYMIKRACSKIQVPLIVEKIIAYVADNCFGVYLFSVFAQVKLIGIYELLDDGLKRNFPLICCLLYVAIVMIIEVIAVSIIRKIPIVRKYI